jgi:ribosome biogenesis GTPase / thiamine phosphate phosphatase
MSKKRTGKKERTEFKKNHQVRARRDDLTRTFHESEGTGLDDIVNTERVSGKGDLTRHRVLSEQTSVGAIPTEFNQAIAGRVLSVHGLNCRVFGDDGRQYRCAVRRVLKNLNTEQRQVVVAGDRVIVRVDGEEEGFIDRIEPRIGGVLSRTSRGRQHVLAANCDWMLIIASLAEPTLKPHLIDRFLLTAEQCQVRPVICFNKADLVDQTELQPMVGAFAQMGYRTLVCSATSGQGIDYLRALVTGRQTVVAGQSGVGKSSLLNAIEPGLALRVSHVSGANSKGRHTTTTASLIPLSTGGFVVDTPGIRQFQLWDISPNEVASLMPDFRPFESACRYPDCLHLHENGCRVKQAVADGHIDPRRYDSYCHLIEEGFEDGN